MYGFDTAAPHHARARDLLEASRSGPERLVLFPVVLAGFLRVMTDRRIFVDPVHPDAAMGFLDALLDGPSVRIVHPGVRHWAIVRDLVGTHASRGPEMTDVVLAASAIEQGLTWVSFDRGFARFPQLTWVNPADAA